jgi:homocitrate synthase
MPLDHYSIIESTLREGEQFTGANFDREQKIRIAQALDEFGVECLELSSPVASPASAEDVRAIARLGLRANVLTHIRCDLEDARVALDTGVDGLDVVIGTSSPLRKFSHGKSIDEIIALAEKVLPWIRAQAPHIQLRFSTEDTFRSNEADLWRVYLAVDRLGVVNRLGTADTVGIATPTQVHRLVSTLRRFTHCDIEFHGHNDSGCAIANAFAALEGGATHIDTTVLGIGERNGITPLGGFIARMYTHDREATKAKYQLRQLAEIDQLVGGLVGVEIPFNNYITGWSAFSHKAGIHAKAVLNAPETYEALNPDDFGLSRSIAIGHRLTGWNAVRARAEELGLAMDNEQIKAVTRHIKNLADERPLGQDYVDELLRNWAVAPESSDSTLTDRPR